MAEKLCKCCLEVKSIGNFYQIKPSKYYRNECKECVIKRVQDYNATMNRAKKYYQEHKEEIKLKSLRRYHSNKDRSECYRIKFKLSHPTYWKEYWQMTKMKRSINTKSKAEK